MEKLEYEKIEELLIKSVWSDQAARSYLLENINNDEIFRILIQVVETSESGDARMEALKKIIANRIKPALPWEARCLEIYFQGETDGTV